MSTNYFHASQAGEMEIPVEAEGWLEICTPPTFVRSAWNWDLLVTSSCQQVDHAQRQLGWLIE
ncbi:hypothetical protein IQ07DRAFT_642167 [Pyrenochaeta sp. DS3sAY3a]|nr:hypothetical protein IQ07DRAFT_642167 [Pyrenochaeta sp. DS3sAY3a]